LDRRPRPEDPDGVRLEGSGYAVALQAKHGEIVNAPPFDAVVLRIGLLFGDDPD
jgi:hypothetical protein